MRRCSPDVLVWVLDALLQRRHVRPVLPVLVPENICVGAGPDQGGDADAAGGKNMVSPLSPSSVVAVVVVPLRLRSCPGMSGNPPHLPTVPSPLLLLLQRPAIGSGRFPSFVIVKGTVKG